MTESSAPARIIAVDWSGARTGARSKIWLAEADDRRLIRLEDGRDREGIAEHLLQEARGNSRLIVGFDFAFSLPEWFLSVQGISSAAELWTLADRDAEAWIAHCRPPFWGRPGSRRPNLLAHFRRTELDVPAVAGIRPKSVFQIGGAGAVGTGSLRGMRLLHRLSTAGFSVWPFDSPGWPLVVEIYPRLLTGAVNKSSRECRARYLALHYPELSAGQQARVAQSEDSFDAAVSALVMAGHSDDLSALPSVAEPQLTREGVIWYPDVRSRLTSRHCASPPS